jgi:multicomponent K+:H+ antiporter subunit D
LSAGLTTSLLQGHGIIGPIVLPLAAGSLLVVLEKARSRWVPAVSVAATAGLLVLAVALALQAAQGGVQVYLVGNWQVPFGIALALDRLSALMLVLTAAVACAALVYALGGDDRRGEHFHSLFHYQLMGLCGAFLTADLFNLFVFFEVLLAASYGLLLHGATRQRLRAGLHYVVFNLAGSALFLMAVSLLFALTGTLSMADLALKLPALGAQDLRLAQAAALLLLVVFAVKAALLPLYFWLPDTYAAASAPVAALFAIMTKVGVYAITRMVTLVFGASAGGASASIAALALPVLAALSLATLALSAVGALAAQRLRALVAYLVVASAGTLLLAVALGTQAALAAGLFYLVNSTVVACAWFLLADRIAAARGGSDLMHGSPPEAPIATGWAPLGVAFLVASVAVAGVPPLAGFMGKALLLQAAGTTPWAGATVALVLASSLAMMVALARAGSAVFWKAGAAEKNGAAKVAADAGAFTAARAAALPAAVSAARSPTTAVHRATLVVLLAAVAGLAAAAGPLAAYTAATAQHRRRAGCSPGAGGA